MGEEKKETKSETFIKKAIENLMGEVLDLGRINGMGGESQFTQFERTVKYKFNNMSTYLRNKLALKEEDK